MATVNSITFDQPSYTAGATITATVDYTPDAPSSTPQTFTLTANLVNSAGTQVATLSNDFVVDTPQANADTLQVSDNGSRTWTAGAVTADGSGGESAVFSATA